jgi:hypothetical protein
VATTTVTNAVVAVVTASLFGVAVGVAVGTADVAGGLVVWGAWVSSLGFGVSMLPADAPLLPDEELLLVELFFAGGVAVGLVVGLLVGAWDTSASAPVSSAAFEPAWDARSGSSSTRTPSQSAKTLSTASLNLYWLPSSEILQRGTRTLGSCLMSPVHLHTAARCVVVGSELLVRS